MSKTHTETITCPECGKQAEFTVWDSINTTLEPEMRERVKSGELFRWSCPKCGCKVNVNFATLYHDMKQKIMIYYVPGNPEEVIPYMKSAMNHVMEGEEAGQYYKRVVGSPNQLREKLMILEAGLDDRNIELMKLFASTRVKLQDKGFELAEMLFDRAKNGANYFALRLKNGTWQEMEFDQALYQNVAKVFEAYVKNSDAVSVNFDWAVSVMQRQRR